MRTILWLVFAAACSGGSGTPTRPTKPVATPSPDAGTTVAPALTAAECDQLIGHAAELALRERTPAADPPPSDAEKAKLTESLRPLGAECLTLDRAAFRCGMNAPTLAALAACQPTLSSSTSNKSVAPPGITPPAPRSP